MNIEREIRKRVKKYSSLKQYQDKTPEELKQIAKERIEEEQKQALFQLEGEYIDNEERKFAKSLFKKYLDTSHIEHPSEIHQLNKLVWLETWAKRIEKQITEKNEKKQLVPKGLTNDYLSILDKISIIKEQLGLFAKKGESWLEFWGKLLKKLLLYAQSHKGAFYFKCPHCLEMTLILRKIDNYNTFPFIMFKGTHLYNEPLMRFIEEGKLTVEEVAEIWGLPRTDYIKGIYEKVYLAERRKQAIASSSE